jgi:hypothetical protein
MLISLVGDYLAVLDDVEGLVARLRGVNRPDDIAPRCS